jgi:thioredoxin-related protein
MKKIAIILLLALPLLGKAQEKGIRFENSLSWDQIKEKAKSEKKYIFMDVYASWCGPCKMMDRDVYTKDTIGSLMNEKFISVKVQMDSSKNDNEQVRSWYADAKKIGQEYPVQGFPTLLFFSPEGKLAYKQLGFQSRSDFISLAKRALDPQTLKFYTQLEDYRQGKKDYATMGGLAMFVNQTVGDGKLALLIAADYKENCLSKLSQKQLLEREYFAFITAFPGLIDSKDCFFRLSIESPQKVDSVTYPGFGKMLFLIRSSQKNFKINC